MCLSVSCWHNFEPEVGKNARLHRQGEQHQEQEAVGENMGVAWALREGASPTTGWQ